MWVCVCVCVCVCGWVGGCVCGRVCVCGGGGWVGGSCGPLSDNTVVGNCVGVCVCVCACVGGCVCEGEGEWVGVGVGCVNHLSPRFLTVNPCLSESGLLNVVS